MKNISQRLSAEAINDLRKIYEKEFNEVMGESEAEEMAMRLLNLFSVLDKQKDPGIDLTDQEFAAFRHIHDCLCHYKRYPTARSIAEAIGRRSSRTGVRVLAMLMRRQIVWKNEKGVICIVEGHCDFWGCGN